MKMDFLINPLQLTLKSNVLLGYGEVIHLLGRTSQMTERGQVNFSSGSGRFPASVHRMVRLFFPMPEQVLSNTAAPQI
jgi:hypothetical protein